MRIIEIEKCGDCPFMRVESERCVYYTVKPETNTDEPIEEEDVLERGLQERHYYKCYAHFLNGKRWVVPDEIDEFCPLKEIK